MCVLPAKRLKLKNRGMIQTGYIADLVLLDIPHTPMEKTHIETVLLGGKIAYENNKMTMDFRNEIL
jgi:adenine deaminase